LRAARSLATFMRAGVALGAPTSTAMTLPEGNTLFVVPLLPLSMLPKKPAIHASSLARAIVAAAVIM